MPVNLDEIDTKVQRKLTHRGVLASELSKAAQDVAERMTRLYDVRGSYDSGYLHWSDVNRICRIVADNVRRARIARSVVHFSYRPGNAFLDAMQ